MNPTPTPVERLTQLRARFAAWRMHRIRGARIPEELWAAATDVARALGANRVAWALRLDPAMLRLRIARAAHDEPDEVTPTFVAITPAVLGVTARADTADPARDTTVASAVEVTDERGRRLRVELAGTSDWLTVARQLWDLAR